MCYFTEILWNFQEEERKGGKKGRLLGIITLSDVLRYIIGEVAIGEAYEPPEEPVPAPSTTPITTVAAPPPPPPPAQEEAHESLEDAPAS